jgi:hypothetical protein
MLTERPGIFRTVGEAAYKIIVWSVLIVATGTASLLLLQGAVIILRELGVRMQDVVRF